MSLRSQVQIGFIGFGTVLGEGAAQLLAEKDLTSEFSIKYVVVRNVERYRERYPHIDPSVFIADVHQLLDDPEVKIVVEATGGVDQPAQYIKKALKAKKHVVSANKDAVATHTSSLFFAARSNHVHLRFEGAVAGGVDVLDPLLTLSKQHQIGRFAGILNGTSNYILTQMSTQGLSFDAALAIAQEKGFAESNPDSDVKGKDAAYKLILLAALAYGIDIEPHEIKLKGIDEVTSTDMEAAKECGYTIKLIAQAVPSESNHGLWALVSPTWVHQSTPFYGVDNEYNIIMMDMDGQAMQFGPNPGAGAAPTGRSVVKDIELVQRFGMECELLPGVVLDTDDFVSDWVLSIPIEHPWDDTADVEVMWSNDQEHLLRIRNSRYGDLLTQFPHAQRICPIIDA